MSATFPVVVIRDRLATSSTWGTGLWRLFAAFGCSLPRGRGPVVSMFFPHRGAPGEIDSFAPLSRRSPHHPGRFATRLLDPNRTGVRTKSAGHTIYKKGPLKGAVFIDGAPGEIRTPDLLVRSQTLYPTELRARDFGLCRRVWVPGGRAILPCAGRQVNVGLLSGPQPFGGLGFRWRSRPGNRRVRRCKRYS